MSAASEAKAESSLALWCARLTPALGHSLLPELIRLTAEYARPLHRWSTALNSKRCILLDGDGAARQLHWQPNAPGAQDEGGATGWWVALSEQTIGEYAGACETATWTVRVEQWAVSFAWGVAGRDFVAKALRDGIRGCPGGLIARAGRSAHDVRPLRGASTQKLGSIPTADLKFGEHIVVRCTADVKAGVLEFAVGVVDSTGRVDPARVRMATPPPQRVPGIGKHHFFVASVQDMRVTLLDE